MNTSKIDAILNKQTNGLYGKGISANQYHKIILPIIFIKFLTSKVEKDFLNFAEQRGLNPSEDVFYNQYIKETEFNQEMIAIDYEYLWSNIRNTSSDDIKKKLDGVFISLEKYEPKYKDMSIYSYSSSDLQNSNLLKQIEFIENNYSFDGVQQMDLFGYVYEFFLETYNVQQGRGGEFYTPHSIVKMMASITEDRFNNKKQSISVYDPTMGSGGMLSQSLEFLTKKGFTHSQINFFGQELIKDTWNMSRMNFLLRTQSWDFGTSNGDTFLNDMFKGKKFDIILSNPPFNIDFKKEEYGHLISDERFSKYGLVFGSGRANYNFFTHILSHLADGGMAAVLMQPAAGTSSQEKEIREKYLKDNVIEAIIKLPQNIFVNAAVGAYVWIFNKNKANDKILMIDLEGNTTKTNKLETISDEIIEWVLEVFNSFVGEKEIVTKIPFAITSSSQLLKEEEFKINVSQFIKKEEVKVEVNAKAIAKELEAVSNEIEQTLIDVKKVISYFNK